MSLTEVWIQVIGTVVRRNDSPEQFTAMLPDLGILIAGSGDDAEVERAVDENVEFLVQDLTKESLVPLIEFLEAQDVAYQVIRGGVNERIHRMGDTELLSGLDQSFISKLVSTWP